MNLLLSYSMVAVRGCLAAGIVILLTISSVSAAVQTPAPVGLWTAEWLRDDAGPARAIGFLRLKNGALTFSLANQSSFSGEGSPRAGQLGWELPLAELKGISALDKRTLVIEGRAGERFALVMLKPDLTEDSSKRGLKDLERALELAASTSKVR